MAIVILLFFTMPQIPQSAISKGSTYLKPDSFDSVNFGDRITFSISGPHVENVQADGRTTYSLPVHTPRATSDGKSDGSFSINKTNMKMFVDALGDNSDTWTGAEFTALVMPVRNPQTNAQTKGWSVIKDSIKRPVKKAGK